MTARRWFLLGCLLPGGLVLSPAIAAVWWCVDRWRTRNVVQTVVSRTTTVGNRKVQLEIVK